MKRAYAGFMVRLLFFNCYEAAYGLTPILKSHEATKKLHESK
jgi:hypothetical protein